MPPPRAMFRATLVIAACLVLLAAVTAWAIDFPPLTGRVVDNAALLTPAQREQLTATLAAHEQATGNQVAVATVGDLAGLPIEDYANGLYRAWQLGQAGKDNGVLLLIAPKERRMRIEVGYGLEPMLTDAASKLIIAQRIAPAFREGRYFEGISAGVDAILATIGGGEAPKPTATRPPPESGGTLDLASGLFLLFLVLLVVWQNYRYRSARAAGDPWIARGRRRPGIVVIPGGWPGGGGWGGGSGGGGGWSGGGGSSGGGGASGDW